MKLTTLLAMIFFISIQCFASNVIHEKKSFYYGKGNINSIQESYKKISVLLSHRISELEKLNKAKHCVVKQRKEIKEIKDNINFWNGVSENKKLNIIEIYTGKLDDKLKILSQCQSYLLEHADNEEPYKKYIKAFNKYPLFFLNNIIKIPSSNIESNNSLEKAITGYKIGIIIFYISLGIIGLLKWPTTTSWTFKHNEVDSKVKIQALIASGAILFFMVILTTVSTLLNLNPKIIYTLITITIIYCIIFSVTNTFLYSKMSSVAFRNKAINCYITYVALNLTFCWLATSIIARVATLNFLTDEISPFWLTTAIFILITFLMSWLLFLISLANFSKNIIFNVVLVIIYQGVVSTLFIYLSYPQIIFVPILLAFIIFFKEIISCIYNIDKLDNPLCKRVCNIFLINRKNKVHELSLLCYMTCIILALRIFSAIFNFDLESLIFNEHEIFNTSFSLSHMAIALFVFLSARLIIKTIANFIFPSDSSSITKNINYNSSYQLCLYIGTAMALVLAFMAAGFNAEGILLIIGALSVGIGISLRGIIANLISGLILHFENPIKVGDYIQIDNHEGRVIKTGVRATQIKTLTNIDVFIPNENLISENILNYSSDASGSKIQIYVGIAYDSDVVHISKILHDLLEKTPGVIMNDNVGNPITRVVFEKISDYELTIKLAVALENIKKKEIIKSKINAGIIEVFSKHGIKLPYPKNDITIINHKDK